MTTPRERIPSAVGVTSAVVVAAARPSPAPTENLTTSTGKITVMISSRCSDKIMYDEAEHALSDFRVGLKTQLEDLTLLGDGLKPFQVWINEDEGGGDQSYRVWDRCLRQARMADIILVLYNGNSGWAGTGGVGICHAELQHALAKNPRKVRVVQLEPLLKPGRGEDGRRHRLFQDYVKRQHLMTEVVKPGEEIFKKCRRALFRAVVEMTKYAARDNTRGAITTDALSWSEMSFRRRRDEMVKSLCAGLMNSPGAERSVGKKGHAFIRVRDESVLFLCHAVPAAMSIPSAREMFGQPFLDDYRYTEHLGERHAGPVHVVACHRTVTESQAIKQLGFPDATVVSLPFGVYVADNVQKIQLVFLANCRDDTATREGVKRFFDWLEQTEEEEVRLAQRAASRRNIIGAIAREA
jgi:hypothetical protein